RVARSTEQIRENMFKRLTGQEPDLVGLWNFESGDARDSSTNHHHGRFAGGAHAALAEVPSSADQLPAFAIIEGTLTDTAGRSISQAELRLEKDQTAVATLNIRANDLGIYRTAAYAKPGAYDVSVSAGDFYARTNVVLDGAQVNRI